MPKAAPDSQPSRAVGNAVRSLVAGYPGFPPAVLQALNALADPTCSADRMAPLVSAIDRLPERVIAVANSAFFGPKHPILDLKHAQVMIGERQLRCLIVGAALRPMFGAYTGYGHEPLGFWKHAIAVATAGLAIAQTYGLSGEECTQIYMAGLFHDTGKLVLSDLMARTNRRVDPRKTPSRAPGLELLERQQLGVGHGYVGRLIAEHWGIDEPVQALIADHHASGRQSRLCGIVRFADYLVSNLELGFEEGMPCENPLDPESLTFFEGDPSFLPRCEAIVFREVARSMAVLDGFDESTT